MYKIVATDMDETFLDHDHQIPEANLEALRRMRELGVLLVPSSGRSYPSIMHNFEHVDPELFEGSYIISYNGGFINRFGDPEPLTTCGLGKERTELVYRRGRELGLCMHIAVADGRYFICDAPQSELDYLSSLNGIVYFKAADEPDLSFLDGLDIVKILYMSEDFEYLRGLGSDLAGFARDHEIDLTYSSGRYLEFMPAGVNKGTGLIKLAEILGIPIDQTIGVGDSANDLEMIQAAGLGLGVSNVSDDVRPHCDVVLDTSGEEGAFMEIVDRFLVGSDGPDRA
ncbi:MAG: HAD-IIB family hydrolase [Collinsella sp.]|nr:HAD-IIB family hydrolase [Collinsella sp.]